MKKLFKKVWNTIKSWFCKKPAHSAPVVTEATDVTELDMDNFPVDPDNIKQGEIGGYILYCKSKATVDEKFINNLKNLNISLLYFNTPRKDPNLLTYEEWYEIFDKFKDSGIKLMIYCYEATKQKWTNEQIQSISNHPSFYAWIAEDEVTYESFNSSNAWITRFHNQKIGKDRKWPNMSITYLPKLSSLKASAIGDKYEDYLELWANSADHVMADQYPIIASQKDGAHYNTESDGIPVYSKSSGGEKWHDYLREHLSFTNRHPELTHRLYIQSCLHIAVDNNKKPYIVNPKPTVESVRVQAYANLMSGSNGLMLFTLQDIPNANGTGFYEAAFRDDLSTNEDTYELLKSIFTSTKFNNFKNLITNLRIDYCAVYDDLLECIAYSNEYRYNIYLNTSLTELVSVLLVAGNNVLNLASSTVTTLARDMNTIVSPGDIVCIKTKLK